MKAYYAGKAIMTKSRARSSHLLTQSQYREIMNLTTMTDVAAWLRGTHYASCMTGMPERGFSRAELQSRLRNDIYSHFLKVIRFDRSEHSFYRYLLLELEVSSLIHAIQMLRLGTMADFSSEVPEMLIPFFSFDIPKLSEIRSFSDLVAMLIRTPWYTLLRSYITGNDRDLDHLGIEAVLRKYQTEHILNLIQALPSKSDRVNLRSFYSRFLELENLRALYRLKGLETSTKDRATELFTYLPFGQLHAGEWRAVANATSQNHFLDLLQKTSLGRDLGDLKAPSLLGSSYFGLLTQHLHFRNCKKLLRFANEGPSAFMALHMLHNIEISNLTALTEGTHYRLDLNQIRVLLVF